MDMDLLTFIDLAKRYADLGDAVGSQVKAAAEAWASGSEEPICGSESNPNAFSMYQTRDLLRALSDEEVPGADEFYEAISAELGRA